MIGPNDVFLYPGEPNPNDVKLRIGSQIASQDGAASGDIIVVDVSLVAGVATGVKKSATTGGGSVTMVTPAFTMRPPKPKKRAEARGAVLGVTVTLIPGVAVGTYEGEDFPPPTKKEIQIQIENDNFILMAAGRR